MSDLQANLISVLVGVSPYHTRYSVGATTTTSKGCASIVLKNDGLGVSGYYDRVHVYFDDGRHLIIPAHNCTEMEVAP